MPQLSLFKFVEFRFYAYPHSHGLQAYMSGIGLQYATWHTCLVSSYSVGNLWMTAECRRCIHVNQGSVLWMGSFIYDICRLHGGIWSVGPKHGRMWTEGRRQNVAGLDRKSTETVEHCLESSCFSKKNSTHFSTDTITIAVHRDVSSVIKNLLSAKIWGEGKCPLLEYRGGRMMPRLPPEFTPMSERGFVVNVSVKCDTFP